MEKKKLKIWKAVLGVLIAVLLVSGSGAYIYASSILEKDVIYEGVSIKGVDVSNLTKDEAKEKLEKEHGQKLAETSISLEYEQYNKKLNYEDIGVEYDYSMSTEKAYEIGREGSSLERIKEIREVEKEGINLDMELMRDDSKIEEVASAVESDLKKAAVDSKISYSEDGFVVTESISGQAVETDKLKDDIVKGIGSNVNMEELKLEIPVSSVEPKATADALKQINREIASYETTFSEDEENRNYNIWLSSDSIDGKVVMPGEVFSFNDATGLRTRENGYKESIIIVNKEFVPGVGGGVCQTSSTLYQAIAKANLDVVERHNHSKPVGYVPKGEDATVADHYLDFKFRNSFSYPVFIKSDIVDNSLVVRIYGQ